MYDLDIFIGNPGAYGTPVTVYVDNQTVMFEHLFYGYNCREIVSIIREKMRNRFGVKRFRTKVYK